MHGISALLLLGSLLGQPLAHAAEKVTAKSTDRDVWQRPTEVMDALQIKSGSVVADVGAGEGYFSFHLASRVGPQGKVYAEDIEAKKLSKISARAEKERISQIEEILGSPEDPRLPADALDAILVVDAFHEMVKYDAMLQGMYRALKPSGLLGIIDGNTEAGKPRSYYYEHHKIPEQLLREDVVRNGFQFLREETGFKRTSDGKSYYFVIFEKPNPAAKVRGQQG